ncbi:hypothetical protein V8D89_006331 [Ganoderma adspersum]
MRLLLLTTSSSGPCHAIPHLFAQRMAKTPSKPSSKGSSNNCTKKATKQAPAKSTKKKAAQRDSTGDESHDEDSDDEDELDEDGNRGTGKQGGKKLKWDEELTWALITRINENAKIKRGLYPPPGPNPSTANGGGKPKSDFHAELARALFENHAKYGTQFEQAKSDPAKLSKWAGKIKNRMNTLEKKTRRYFDMMGQTGQGITREEEIAMSTNSSIKTTFPYYFEMLELIGQRPNIIHAGVGNSLSEVDTTVIMGNGESDQPLTIINDVPSRSPSPRSAPRSIPGLSDSPPASPSPRSTTPLSRKRSGSFRDLSDTDDDDKEATELLASIKAQNSADNPSEKTATPRKSTPDSEAPTTAKKLESSKSKAASAKKTSALRGSSTPVSKGKGSNLSKKLKFGDQFADAIVAEEHTCQKELDVRLSRTELEKVKLEGKIVAKRDKLRLKAEMQKLAMVQEHEERMAKIHQRQWVLDRVPSSPTNNSAMVLAMEERLRLPVLLHNRIHGLEARRASGMGFQSLTERHRLVIP